MAAGSEGGVGFRRAGPGDVAAVVDLVESAYRGEPSRSGWTTEADLLDGQRTDPDAVAAALGDPGGLVLLAEADGALVGCCQLRSAAGAGHFGMFAVRPGLQGRSVGSALLAHAEGVARQEWDARTMRMEVIAQRAELIAWYLRRGYRATGETAPFPYGDERFGVPRRCDLYFSVLEKPLAP